MGHCMDASALRRNPGHERTGFNERSRRADFSKRDFSAEARFLDLDYLTISLLLRPYTHKNVSIGSYEEPDTLTSSSPPKLSWGFCFWRVFCCFLSLEATAAGESPRSWAALSSVPVVAESSTSRALDDCDGLDCLRLKMTGASSVMAFKEMDQRRKRE